jgi:hypothetical protein
MSLLFSERQLMMVAGIKAHSSECRLSAVSPRLASLGNVVALDGVSVQYLAVMRRSFYANI